MWSCAGWPPPPPDGAGTSSGLSSASSAAGAASRSRSGDGASAGTGSAPDTSQIGVKDRSTTKQASRSRIAKCVVLERSAKFTRTRFHSGTEL